MSEDFRRVKRLGERRLSFDAWIYHHQLPELIDFVKTIPTTKIVLDHFGTPLGVGPYETKKSEIFDQWKNDIASSQNYPIPMPSLAARRCPTTDTHGTPAIRHPSSDEIVASQPLQFTMDCLALLAACSEQFSSRPTVTLLHSIVECIQENDSSVFRLEKTIYSAV